MKYSVRFPFALILSACVLGAFSPRLLAQGKPPVAGKPVEEELAALLDDETFCIVHVDFAKIDTDAILLGGQGFVDRQLDKLGLTAADRGSLCASLRLPGVDLRSNWDLGRNRLKAGKTFLVDTLGIGEAFLVVQSGGKSFPALVWAAIPKRDRLKAATLGAVLKADSFLVRETNDFFFVAMLDASLARRVNPANVGPNRPARRPEFLEAYQVMKEYPVQLIIAPPKYVKRVFRETRPTLPGALERIDIASLPGALRWAAIGIRPEKLALLAVAEAESEDDAQLLYRNGSELFRLASEELISMLRKYKDVPRDKTPRDLQALSGAYPEAINEENLKRLGQYLLPKPQAKRFVVQGDGDTLQALLNQGAPFVRSTIEKLTEDGRARQRSMLPKN
jgi:hypothetical protein